MNHARPGESTVMEELTLEELVRYIVRIQRDSFLFYRKAAKILEGNEHQPITDELADLKAHQLMRLKDILVDYTLDNEKDDSMVDVDTTLFDELLENVDIPAQATPRDVLALSLDREGITVKTFYMVLDLPIETESVKQVFRTLVEGEQKYIRILRKRLDGIRRR
jgi:rubrerythrin